MSIARIVHLGTLDEMDALKSVWQRFEQQDQGPSIFQSWQWNRAWCDQVLGTLRNARLDIHLAEDGAGRPLAILPFFKQSLAGPAIQLIQFLGHRMSYRNDILMCEPWNRALADELAVRLREDLRFTQLLHLRHLPGDAPFTRALRQHNWARSQCVSLWLHKDPLLADPYLRLGRARRKTLRNKRNRLYRSFDITIKIQAGEAFAQAFDELMLLHHKRFTDKGEASLLQGDNLDFLKHATVNMSQRGRFEIIQMQADGRTIAALLMGIDRRRYFFVQSGFDPEFARFSPVFILKMEAMKRCFEALGCEIYDFGPGYEAYKYYWHPKVSENFSCCLAGGAVYEKTVAALYHYLFLKRLPVLHPSEGEA